jgi:small subunit ribosomal protein S25e
MGGATKKPLTAMEKAQRREEEKAQQKRKEAKKEQQQSKQLGAVQLKMSEEQILNTLAPLKAITIYAAAKALGVKASVAAATLRNLYQKGLLRKEGGFSGHPIYALNQRS